MSNLKTVTFYSYQFQPKLTGGTNFCQTTETYLYTSYYPSLDSLVENSINAHLQIGTNGVIFAWV